MVLRKEAVLVLKDLVLSISLEADELLKGFQWSGVDTDCEEI